VLLLLSFCHPTGISCNFVALIDCCALLSPTKLLDRIVSDLVLGLGQSFSSNRKLRSSELRRKGFTPPLGSLTSEAGDTSLLVDPIFRFLISVILTSFSTFLFFSKFWSLFCALSLLSLRVGLGDHRLGDAAGDERTSVLNRGNHDSARFALSTSAIPPLTMRRGWVLEWLTGSVILESPTIDTFLFSFSSTGT
jgi:hypothetical protein